QRIGNSNALLPMTTVASAGAYLLSTLVELGPNARGERRATRYRHPHGKAAEASWGHGRRRAALTSVGVATVLRRSVCRGDADTASPLRRRQTVTSSREPPRWSQSPELPG